MPSLRSQREALAGSRRQPGDNLAEEAQHRMLRDIAARDHRWIDDSDRVGVVFQDRVLGGHAASPHDVSSAVSLYSPPSSSRGHLTDRRRRRRTTSHGRLRHSPVSFEVARWVGPVRSTLAPDIREWWRARHWWTGSLHRLERRLPIGECDLLGVGLRVSGR